LQLSSAKLNHLHLPVAVHHGSIGSFEVVVPWAKLDSEPVVVRIDSIYLQVGALGENALKPEEALARERMAKQATLKRMEVLMNEQIKKSNEGKTQQWSWGWGQIQQLVTKIVDNMIVSITNVHVRYEDWVTITGQTIALGITLESFYIRTTDEHWDVAFVSRSNLDDPTTIRKVAHIQNIALYWQSDPVRLEALEFQAWLEQMLRMIATDLGPSTHLTYILYPSSQKLKVIHRETIPAEKPKFSVVLDSNEFNILVDRVQLNHLSRLQTELTKLTLRLRFLRLRPIRSPLQDARAWWRYACKFILNKSQTPMDKSDKAKDLWWGARTLLAREQYVALYKRSQKLTGLKPLHSHEQEILQQMDDVFSVDTLVVLRRIAKQQIASEEQSKKAQEAKSKGFIGYW
jgi:vacuolar protein sorting-associated protein 13A/C